MPWYKLPHADLVMHFDQEMDMEPADEPFATVMAEGYREMAEDSLAIAEANLPAAPNAPEPDEEVAIDRGQDPGQIHASTLAKLLHLRSKVADKKTDKRTEAT